MAVPEVAVYEDGDFLAPKDDVGLAGAGFDVRGEVDFAGFENGEDNTLWLRAGGG